MIKLWIDDVRLPPRGWVWAQSSREALEIISNPNINISQISFDHDLGESDTVIPVCEYFEEQAYFHRMKPPKWNIHSANPVGRKNIEVIMKSAERFIDIPV